MANTDSDARRIVEAILADNFGTHGLIRLIQTIRPRTGGYRALHSLATLLAHPEDYKRGFVPDWLLKSAKSQLHKWLHEDQHTNLQIPPTMKGPFPIWASDLCRARLDLYYDEFIPKRPNLSPSKIQQLIKNAFKHNSAANEMVFQPPSDRNEALLVAQLYSIDRLSCMVTKESLFNELFRVLLKIDAVTADEQEKLRENLSDKLYLLYMCSLNGLSFAFPEDKLWNYECECDVYVYPSIQSGPYANPQNKDRLQVNAGFRFKCPSGDPTPTLIRTICFSDFDVDTWTLPSSLESSLYGKKIGPMRVTGSYFHELTDDFKVRLY